MVTSCAFLAVIDLNQYLHTTLNCKSESWIPSLMMLALHSSSTCPGINKRKDGAILSGEYAHFEFMLLSCIEWASNLNSSPENLRTSIGSAFGYLSNVSLGIA